MFISYSKKNILSPIIASKIYSLYKTYWVVLLVFIPLCLVLNVDAINIHNINLNEVLLNFLGLSSSYNGETWFLLPYIILMAAYPILNKFLRKYNELFIDVFIILAIYLFVNYIIPNLYQYAWASSMLSSSLWVNACSALNLLPVFLTGCIFAKYNILTIIKKSFLETIFIVFVR